MTCVSYVGKVLKDGHLSLPKGAREALQLEAGQEVEVLVRTRDNAQQLSDEAYAPLRTLIGLAQTGKRDASVQHDTYLYGKKGGRTPLGAEEPRVRMACTLYADQSLTVPDICRVLRISQATFYRYVALGRRTAKTR